jgi:hypothetical protein
VFPNLDAFCSNCLRARGSWLQLVAPIALSDQGRGLLPWAYGASVGPVSIVAASQFGSQDH